MKILNRDSVYDLLEAQIVTKMDDVKWEMTKPQDVIKFSTQLDKLRRQSMIVDVVTSNLSLMIIVLLAQVTITAAGLLANAPKIWLLGGMNLGTALLLLYVFKMRTLEIQKFKEQEKHAAAQLAALKKNFPQIKV